jgi:hypothetical protein
MDLLHCIKDIDKLLFNNRISRRGGFSLLINKNILTVKKVGREKTVGL